MDFPEQPKGRSAGGGGSNNTTTTTSTNSKTTTTTATLNFNDSSRFYHRIAPKVTLDKAVADGLKLGLVVQAPVTITTTTNDRYSETKTYSETTVFNPINSAEGRTTRDETRHTPQGLTETTALSVSPQLRIGASYVLIPSRFTVNAGVNLDPTVYSYTKTTQSRNGDGVRTTSTTKNGDGVVTSKSDTTNFANPPSGSNIDSSTINNSWAAFNGSVGGGFLLNFNENVALDFWANGGGFSSVSNNWSIDASWVNVMLTFKF